jgi:hypothetical protein
MANANPEREPRIKGRGLSISERSLFYIFALLVIVDAVSLAIFAVQGQFFTYYSVSEAVVLPVFVYLAYRFRRRRGEPIGKDFYM